MRTPRVPASTFVAEPVTGGRCTHECQSRVKRGEDKRESTLYIYCSKLLLILLSNKDRTGSPAQLTSLI